MRREADWQLRLAAWVRARWGAPFAWGHTDCAILCLEAIDAMTGASHAMEIAGRYGTANQALRFQRRKTSLTAWLEAHGLLRATEARTGDIVVVEKDGFECGHVVLGRFVLSAAPGQGVTAGELAALDAMPKTVWRLPCLR